MQQVSTDRQTDRQSHLQFTEVMQVAERASGECRQLIVCQIAARKQRGMRLASVQVGVSWRWVFRFGCHDGECSGWGIMTVSVLVWVSWRWVFRFGWSWPWVLRYGCHDGDVWDGCHDGECSVLGVMAVSVQIGSGDAWRLAILYTSTNILPLWLVLSVDVAWASVISASMFKSCLGFFMAERSKTTIGFCVSVCQHTY